MIEAYKDSSFKDKVIIGRNGVMEALKANSALDTIYVLHGDRHGSIHKIIAMAKDHNVVVKKVSVQKLQSLCGEASHQGVAAVLTAVAYSSVEQMLERAIAQNEQPFLIIADEIEDPHNLGALIRTAEACGAHGMIIPKRRSASLTQTVYKTSAGAAHHLPVARVSNIATEIDALKAKGFWIYGADMDGETWCSVDYAGAIALVIGSEGKGIGKLVRSKCDFLVSIPMYGQVTSLNASVAGGIFMYEIMRQRKDIQIKK